MVQFFYIEMTQNNITMMNPICSPCHSSGMLNLVMIINGTEIERAKLRECRTSRNRLDAEDPDVRTGIRYLIMPIKVTHFFEKLQRWNLTAKTLLVVFISGVTTRCSDIKKITIDLNIFPAADYIMSK
jgi:hypothetical protein